jgi:hypothetical protein
VDEDVVELCGGADIDSVLSPGTPFLFAGDPQGCRRP